MSTGRLAQEEIYFNGGLDNDSDERFVRQGDYVDAKNIIKVEDGEGGIVVNIKGTEAVYGSIDSSSRWLVGWAFYDKNESVILFIYQKSKLTPFTVSNKIIEFNPQTKVATTIIDDDVLGFEKPDTTDYFVKTDMLGDWLAWTDNVNPPRMINISDLSGVTDLSNYIDLHKARPTASSFNKYIPPVVDVGYDGSKSYNNLTTGYQFKYRYVYEDFRPTVWSPASDLAISGTLVRSDGEGSLIRSENYITVKFYSGHNNIGYIDIAVREGNNGNWFRIVKIDKSNPENVYDSINTTLQTAALSDNTNYIYRFYNDSGRVAISNTEASKAYDTVPETCETLSFIGDNRLTLGGCTEGKDIDSIELDVTLVAQDTNVVLFDGWDIASKSQNETSITVVFDLDHLTTIDNTLFFSGDYVYWNWEVSAISLSTGSLSISMSEYVVFDTLIEGLDNVGQYIVNNTPDPDAFGDTGTWAINYVSASNQVQFVFTPDTYTINDSGSIVTDDSLVFNKAYSIRSDYINDLGFKRGKKHKLALIYEDKYGVKYPALTSTETEIEIEPLSSGAAAKHAAIQYTINNEAPSDAVAYRWAYAYKSPSFIQVVVTDESYFVIDETNLSGELIALDISANNIFSSSHYDIEIGDKITIIREGNAYSILGNYVDDAPEFIIKDLKTTINDGSSDITGNWIIIKPANSVGYSYDDLSSSPLPPSRFMNALIEISKQESSDDDYIFNEISSGGYCVGGTTNHDDWYTGTKTGYLNQGDVWYRPITRYRRNTIVRTSIQSIIQYIEDPYPYNTAPQKDVGIADVNVEFAESESKYNNWIRWSNNFIEDTQVNGLSTFDNLNRRRVSENHGKLKGLEELGNSLVVICEEKVLSGFVGATEYTDTQGNVNVVKSTTPIGYLRPHAEKYGTFLKESIVNTGQYIYFYDLFNGAVVRKAANGLYPISGKISIPNGAYDYKMRSYFKAKSDDLIDSLFDGIESSSVSGIVANYADVKCYMGYDSYYDNIYVTFIDRIDSTNSETIIFNETVNRWISKYEHVGTETYYLASQYLFTRNDLFNYHESAGVLYELNSDTAYRAYIYGEQRDSYIQFVSHLAPNQIKIFNTLWIHSDKEWIADPIEAESNQNYPNGMYTKILSSEWVKEEGVYKAVMPRNMKSRSSLATNYDRINGDELRNYVIKVKLTNDDTTKAQLFKVDIGSELSR